MFIKLYDQHRKKDVLVNKTQVDYIEFSEVMKEVVISINGTVFKFPCDRGLYEYLEKQILG